MAQQVATAAAIHDEAMRARIAAEDVLEKLAGPRTEDEDEDPLSEVLAALVEVVAGQAVLLRRLDAIERRLDRPQHSGSGSRS